MPAHARVARAAPHFGEEPCISGTRGSGTVFFSGCSLGCGYCQNAPISLYGKGRTVTVAQLRRIFVNLIEQGVHNLSLVTATHFLPDILQALPKDRTLPIVYNTGGYETVQTVRALADTVDVWLPDLKYAETEPAERFSHAPDYFPTATAAIQQMAAQTGPPVFNREGILMRGVLIRHLVLPGYVQNSLKVLDWIADTFRPGEVLVSLMGQYVPCGPLADTAPLCRTVTAEEYGAVRSWMMMLGLDHGYWQDLSSADTDQIPAFDGTGVE